MVDPDEINLGVDEGKNSFNTGRGNGQEKNNPFSDKVDDDSGERPREEVKESA